RLPKVDGVDGLVDMAQAYGLTEEVGQQEVERVIGDAFKRAEREAKKGNGKAQDTEIKLDDFVAYPPMHNYLFKPTREMWPGGSVNARIPPIGKTSASAWLDANSAVEQMTWAPGEPMLIRDRLVSDGGWIKRKGVTCFNLYRPPTLERGDWTKAGP